MSLQATRIEHERRSRLRERVRDVLGASLRDLDFVDPFARDRELDALAGAIVDVVCDGERN